MEETPNTKNSEIRK